jgi:hypothetical protein
MSKNFDEAFLNGRKREDEKRKRSETRSKTREVFTLLPLRPPSRRSKK